jgi:hypothetical protein
MKLRHLTNATHTDTLAKKIKAAMSLLAAAVQLSLNNNLAPSSSMTLE